jgi:hypothetical protein
MVVVVLVPFLKETERHFPGMYCLATLNALNKSAIIYAEGNRGFLMPYTHNLIKSTELTEAAPTADHTSVCFANEPLDPVTGLLADHRNYGIVYVIGLLGPAEMFYCPDQEYPPAMLKHYPKPWGSAVPEGSQYIYGGYMYNPWVKATTTEGKQFVYEDGLVYERHPSNRFLTADLMFATPMSPHIEGKVYIWNLGFPDGHVERFKSKPLTKLLLGNPNADWTSWNRWGSVSADGNEAPTGTVRYEIIKAMKKGLGAQRLY